jgi:monomeric isocitrate dehydrogenase
MTLQIKKLMNEILCNEKLVLNDTLLISKQHLICFHTKYVTNVFLDKSMFSLSCVVTIYKVSDLNRVLDVDSNWESE